MLLFFGVSSGLRAARRVDSSPMRALLHCPSDTARSVKVNPLTSLYCLTDNADSVNLLSLSHRHRWSELNPLRYINLLPNFSLCALRLARPLLSCHPSCPDAPRCPLVAIQLFIFLTPPPPPLPVRMCRLYDSREIQVKGFDFKRRPLLRAPGQFVWCSFLTHCLFKKKTLRFHPYSPRLRATGLSLPLSPVGSDSAPQ